MAKLWLLALLVVPLLATEWDESSFPNPTGSGYRACKMLNRGSLCDPDDLLTQQDRQKLNYFAQQIEERTRQDYGRNYCEKKGITTAVAVVKHVRGGSEAHVKALANALNRKWNLDQQCQKSIVLVVSVEDRRFHVGRAARVPVLGEEFTQFFSAERSQFQQNNHVKGITNVLDRFVQRTKDLQGSLPSQPVPSDTGRGGKGGSRGLGGFKMPSIPKWVVILIVFVVIPTLLCCCICYCCCCRNRGQQQPVPQDVEGGGAQGGGGGGNSFLQTIRNSAIGSMVAQLVMNCMRNRNQGGGGGAYPAGGRGAYTPGQPVPAAKEGQGLYPSKPVQDEGGGGSW